MKSEKGKKKKKSEKIFSGISFGGCLDFIYNVHTSIVKLKIMFNRFQKHYESQ